MKLAKNLKEFRKANKLSQQEMAVLCKFSISTIQKLEQEELDNPTLDTLLVLAKVTKQTIDQLVK